MAPKIKQIIEKYKITEEDQKILGITRIPMLSGRVLETEKKAFIKICKKRNCTQSDELRKLLDFHLRNEDISWNDVKILKGETLKGLKTVPVRVKVSDWVEKETVNQCKKNKVTVSSYVRYLVVLYINNGGGPI